MPLRTKPVTAETWVDFERLFTSKGAPHFCWCTPMRFRGAHLLGNEEKKAAMHGLVAAGTPVGILAYEGDEPVGWCSVAPRESYAKLDRSRTMPRVTPPAVATWTVLCFFVPRSHREQGVVGALLAGAVTYAKKSGAREIEGYPWDSAGITSTHRGHSSVFVALGFVQDGRRWSLRLRAPRARTPKKVKSRKP